MKKIPVRQLKGLLSNNMVGRFHVRDLNQVMEGDDLLQDLHRHDYYFILVVEKGKGKHQVDFRDYEVKDRSVFILRPGQVHELSIKAGATGYLLEFDSAFYHPQDQIKIHQLRKAAYKNFCRPESSRFKKLIGLLQLISEENRERQEGYAEAIRSLLDVFFIEYNRQSEKPWAIEKTAERYNNDRLEELYELLRKNLASTKQPATYAAQMNLSLFQLNAITKASVGKPVSHLINDHILLEAKRLLLATSSQVKEIADELGYEDISYFSRFFRKHTGLTPEAFRQKHR